MLLLSAADAIRKFVKSGDRIFIHGGASTPEALISALVQQASRLRGVEITHIHTEGGAPYAAEEFEESFHINAFFIAANTRDAVNEGRADYIPMFLSEIPNAFRRKVLPLDVAFVHVSPPDKHGFCSLGPSVDIALAAVESARYVVAQVNPQVPRVLGDGVVPFKRFDAVIEVDTPLLEAAPEPITALEETIGAYIAELVEDGATLQMGIGAIPNAVLSALKNHKRLGVHSEMFTDGLIDLVESGVVTGEEKKWEPFKIIAGFVLGTQRLYDFINDNPSVELHDIGQVNDTTIIRKNPRVTAINSAIEVDLTGQVCADSIGKRHISGVGGQMDFIRGASLSPGGKPIIALPSITRKGESRITSFLKTGAGVVTTRANVHYVVTEYGVANLYGQNLRQRARALINIAHPDHRPNLEEEAFLRFKTF